MPCGQRSKPGLFDRLLRGSPLDNGWPHLVATHPLAFLVKDFS